MLARTKAPQKRVLVDLSKYGARFEETYPGRDIHIWTKNLVDQELSEASK